MEFKELIAKRRSVRKFTDREVPREVVDRILAEALSAPSARNTRTTRFLVVDDPVLVARMAEMRDYGSAFLKGAPLAVLVLGDTSASDLWRENAAISLIMMMTPTAHFPCGSRGLLFFRLVVRVAVLFLQDGSGDVFAEQLITIGDIEFNFF